MNSSASTAKSVVAGVLQGSMDGSLLFNIFIKNQVLFILYSILGYKVAKGFLTFLGEYI